MQEFSYLDPKKKTGLKGNLGYNAAAPSISNIDME